MISFDPPVILQPPPYTDSASNKIITPNAISLTSLNLVYTDHPFRKTVSAHVEGLPINFTVYSGQAYDDIGDWTKSGAEKIILSLLGPDPTAFLQSQFPRTLEQDPNGPGTILAGMIKSLGINASPTCSCRQRAIQMNIEGPDWCEENIETIIVWLREEAKKRSLPFIDIAVRAMVKAAISKSRRLLNK